MANTQGGAAGIYARQQEAKNKGKKRTPKGRNGGGSWGGGGGKPPAQPHKRYSGPLSNPNGPADPWKYDASRRAPHNRGSEGRNIGVAKRTAPERDPAGPTAAPVNNYDAMFRASLDKSRANIDAQLRSTLAAIGARKGEFDSLVARQPGEVNAAFDYGKTQMANTAAASNQVLNNLNVQSLPANETTNGMQIQQAALEQGRAGSLADQPYLQAGVTDLIARQQGAANQAGMAANADIDNQLSAYLGQSAQTERAAQIEQDNTIRNMEAQARINNQYQVKGENRAAKAAKEEEQRQLKQNEPPKGTAEWWAWNQQANPNKASDFANSSLVKYVNTQKNKGVYAPEAGGFTFNGLWGGGGGPGGAYTLSGRETEVGRKPMSTKDLIKKYKGNKRLVAYLKYQQSGGG